jgi:plasmid stabilization system protein ParE
LAHIIYSLNALSSLERLADFLQAENPIEAVKTVSLITEAIQILENHPLIGRPAEQGIRELVISRGKSGYLALYSYEPIQDTVLVLAVRHQREAGYIEE